MTFGGGERRRLLVFDTNPFERTPTTALSLCFITRR
jgi:hypothetical protein